MEQSKKMLIFGGVLLGILLVGAVLLFAIFWDRPAEETLQEETFNRLSVSFGKDPQTTKNFCWYTETDITRCAVQLVPYVEGGQADFSQATVLTVEGTSLEVSCSFPEGEAGELIPRTNMRHRVYVEGLQPDTCYWYRVGDPAGNQWSKAYQFMTDAGDDRFTFLYVTDTQGFTQGDYTIWKRLIETAMGRHSVDFVAHLGDFVENRRDGFQWQCFFDLPRETLANTTLVPVSGNKDAKTMMDHFTLGSRGDASALGNGWYSFDYGSVHFTVLYTGDDDEDLSKKQVKWLEQDLEASQATWKIVLLHKAPYSDRNHADDREIVALREQLLPVFDRYGVQVVIQGHDHYYFRSEPVSEGQAATYELATVESEGVSVPLYRTAGICYFINGSAGVKQHNKSFREMEEILTKESILCQFPTYTYCQVTSNRILFKTYQVNVTSGSVSLLDAWGLERGV